MESFRHVWEIDERGRVEFPRKWTFWAKGHWKAEGMMETSMEIEFSRVEGIRTIIMSYKVAFSTIVTTPLGDAVYASPYERSDDFTGSLSRVKPAWESIVFWDTGRIYRREGICWVTTNYTKTDSFIHRFNGRRKSLMVKCEIASVNIMDDLPGPFIVLNESCHKFWSEPYFFDYILMNVELSHRWMSIAW